MASKGLQDLKQQVQGAAQEAGEDSARPGAHAAEAEALGRASSRWAVPAGESPPLRCRDGADAHPGDEALRQMGEQRCPRVRGPIWALPGANMRRLNGGDRAHPDPERPHLSP